MNTIFDAEAVHTYTDDKWELLDQNESALGGML